MTPAHPAHKEKVFMEREILEKPKSIEEAVSLVAMSKSFRKKSNRLIKDVLKDHINEGSTEYKQITEDAISEVSTNMLEKAANHPVESAWFTDGLSNFGTPNCLITPYMYKGVANYARTRSKRWSDISKGSEGGARAREVFPNGNGNSENDYDFENWLIGKATHLKTEADLSDTNEQVIKILQVASLPQDIITIVMMRCDNAKYEDIGQTLGLSKDAVRMKMNRAKKLITESVNLHE